MNTAARNLTVFRGEFEFFDKQLQQLGIHFPVIRKSGRAPVSSFFDAFADFFSQ